jgi:hypothetical protein
MPLVRTPFSRSKGCGVSPSFFVSLGSVALLRDGKFFTPEP